MNPRRHLLIALSFATSFACSNALALPQTKDALVGEWIHVETRREFDGHEVAPQPSRYKLILEFTSNGQWFGKAEKQKSSGTYRWVDKSHIEQTTLTADLIALEGQVITREAAIHDKELYLIATQTRADIDKVSPPLRPGERRPNFSKITNVFRRVNNLEKSND
jgi:hypothetical protein